MLTYVEHAVDVVHIAMLPSAVVNVVARHADFRTIEDRRLHPLFSYGLDRVMETPLTSFMSFQI